MTCVGGELTGERDLPRRGRAGGGRLLCRPGFGAGETGVLRDPVLVGRREQLELECLQPPDRPVDLDHRGRERSVSTSQRGGMQPIQQPVDLADPGQQRGGCWRVPGGVRSWNNSLTNRCSYQEANGICGKQCQPATEASTDTLPRLQPPQPRRSSEATVGRTKGSGNTTATSRRRRPPQSITQVHHRAGVVSTGSTSGGPRWAFVVRPLVSADELNQRTGESGLGQIVPMGITSPTGRSRLEGRAPN